MSRELANYAALLGEIKTRIRQAQGRASLSANAEMILMYWDVGRMVYEKQGQEGWGSAVIPRLAQDLHSDIPEIKGFSERNIGRMIAFYRAYPNDAILPQPVAKFEANQIGQQAADQLSIMKQLVSQIPWGHNILLMEKVKDLIVRRWYMLQTIEQGWSRDTLGLMIKRNSHKRQGTAVTNFEESLPATHSGLARQMLKDPYIFDFLTLAEPFEERELEVGLVKHLEKFLLELGQGFAFVGRQYHLEVSDKDFYLDLLFYHLKMRCFVVIELKKGGFKPEYAGKMNFYCSVVDDKLKHEDDQQTIGLILCQDKDKVLAEYALRDIHKPIGVSDYELTRALPDNLKSSLPSIAEIEAEMSGEDGE
ncbi:MAG: PDDEXK nuclease domain-containing protein [Thermodesulfovibrionales bacterium]